MSENKVTNVTVTIVKCERCGKRSELKPFGTSKRLYQCECTCVYDIWRVR